MARPADLIVSVSSFVQSHAGQDKIMRTIQYASKLIDATRGAPALANTASALSNTRIILRFFDFLPMTLHLRELLGKTNWTSLAKQPLQQVVLLEALADTVFYPFEQIAWLANTGLLSVNSTWYDEKSSFCWFLSLNCSIIQVVVKLQDIERQLAHLRAIEKRVETTNTASPASPSMNSDFDQAWQDASSSSQPTNNGGDKELWKSPRRAQIRQLKKQRTGLILTLVKNLADLVNAIDYINIKGFLWSGRSTKFVIAVMGLISSVIGLYKVWIGMRWE
eukprot:m.42406 g.42406  ORF g.42406 m.42406 type:complete len:278 (-) comp16993_c0_seq1:54-887(-)